MVCKRSRRNPGQSGRYPARRARCSCAVCRQPTRFPAAGSIRNCSRKLAVNLCCRSTGSHESGAGCCPFAMNRCRPPGIDHPVSAGLHHDARRIRKTGERPLVAPVLPNCFGDTSFALGGRELSPRRYPGVGLHRRCKSLEICLSMHKTMPTQSTLFCCNKLILH